MNILITESQNFSSKAIAALEEIGTVFILNVLDKDVLKSKLVDIDILVVRLGIFIDEDIVSSGPKLKFIVTATTGLNHIDQNATAKKGIAIVSLKGETDFLSKIPSTAEHTWLLILALTRNLGTAIKHVDNGGWDRNQFIGSNLSGKSIGLIGLGRVGQQVAKFATAFEMTVLAYDPYLRNWPTNVITAQSLKELFVKSDIISIHVPLEKSTRKLLDRRELSNLRKDSILINTSRGEIWDEHYVAELLVSKNVAGVATDVLSDELSLESRKVNPLLGLLNKGYPLIITPHIAGATRESMMLTEEFVVAKLLKLI